MKSNKRPKRKLPIWSSQRKFYYLLLFIGIITFPFAVVIFKALLSGLIASVIFYPYLIALYLPIISLGLLLAFNKKFRYKIKKIFLILVPENKLTRLVLNIGFIVVWFFCVVLINEAIDVDNGNLSPLNGFLWDLYRSDIYSPLMWSLLLVPILLITLFLWYKNIKDVPNTFSKTKKETKRRIKSAAKYLSKSNISDAEELKKYADLRDQGIITEEEFQAKKKQLLDL